MLHKDRALEDFRRVHDVFYGKLCFELKIPLEHRLSPESQKLIQSFSSLYIQFPKFTYLRVGDFNEEPIHLPKFTLDYFFLAEVAQ